MWNLFTFLFGGVGLLGVGAFVKWVKRRRLPLPSSSPSVYHYTQPTLAEVKQHTRVLIVDDKEFEYLELLVQDGYEVDKWTDVESVDAAVRGKYAVVLLDLYGIGKQFSAKDHGLAVLAALRSRSPAQVIGIYSASKWDIGQTQRYFELADEVIDKARLRYPDFVSVLNDLLMRSVDVHRYVAKLDERFGLDLDAHQALSVRTILEASAPDDVHGRVRRLGECCPRLAELSGVELNDLRSILQVALERMRPWIQAR